MIAVVSFDAGGAEILSSYVRQTKPDCLFVLAGPARAIFERKLGPVTRVALRDAIDAADEVLCGSGWQTDLQVEAIRLARAAGKRSTVFLDHWIYYPDRFIRNGETNLPDRIWVGDEYARDLAEAEFPQIPIELVENPYLLDVRKEWGQIERAARRDAPGGILYICEPMREHSLAQFGHEGHWGYTEESALRYFLSNVGALGSTERSIVLRPHPSEDRDKYAWVLEEFDLPVTIGGKESLIEEVANCGIVAGCESMAMVVGLIAGKRVISCVPPAGRPCALPHREIEHLQSILNDAASRVGK